MSVQGGFSFCGVDIADLGLEYAPDNMNTYVYAGSQYKVHEQSFDGHDGGYYYGATVQPKTFALRCIYQHSHINEGILTNVERFFARGKSGRLIFQKRPWVYYVATVTSVEVNTMTNYLNGIVTIHMKAYYPFGRCDDLYIDEASAYATNIMNNSTMLPVAAAMPTSCIPASNILTEQAVLYLHNGGTEPSKVAIEIAGDVGEGVLITNVTTGQKCSFVAQSKAITSDVGCYIVSDGLNGRTIQTNGSASMDASLYHDYGFIDLAPSTVPYKGNCVVKKYTSQITTVDDKRFPDTCIGSRIFVDGTWFNVVGYYIDTDGNAQRNTLLVDHTFDNELEQQTTFYQMNKIIVTPISNMELTKLNFVYKPTFK